LRRIAIDKVRPGMIVSKAVYGNDGRLLIGAGICLKERYIKRLKDLGVSNLVIEDIYFGSVEPPEILSRNVRKHAVSVVAKAMKTVCVSGRVDIREVKDTVEAIIDDILLNKDVLYNFSNIYSYDDYTLEHSVNVSILSILMGISKSYCRAELVDLGIGALLHDVGKIHIEKSILDKPDKLTEEEFEEVKKHPLCGYETLIQNDEINPEAALVALQHHERLDGTGYPKGSKEGDIGDFAKITAVSDTYDALLADRVYRKAVSFDEAVDIIRDGRKTKFDESIVEAFLENVAKYPAGTIVRLNNGLLAMVVQVKREAPDRPIVRLQRKTPEDPFEEIDLSKTDSLSVIEIIDEAEGFPLSET
jgi:HD-GYP domain-containing protein (c-di-GMP phosphodiesterase class II)